MHVENSIFALLVTSPKRHGIWVTACIEGYVRQNLHASRCTMVEQVKSLNKPQLGERSTLLLSCTDRLAFMNSAFFSNMQNPSPIGEHHEFKFGNFLHDMYIELRIVSDPCTVSFFRLGNYVEHLTLPTSGPAACSYKYLWDRGQGVETDYRVT